MPKLLCPHCLQPLDGGYRGECPHCGRSLENRNPEGALPLGTQLGGRYTVGTYLSADGDGLAYRGVLNDEKKFVLIKEYFPVTLCNGRSADGALMPKEEKEVLFKTSRMDFKDLYDDLKNLTPATGLSTILDVMEENNTVYAVEESEKGMTLSHYLHLRSRTLTPAEARTLLQPIMEGVALLHKSGLIHRGICPDNIVLPIDGTARLTGYGTLAGYYGYDLDGLVQNLLGYENTDAMLAHLESNLEDYSKEALLYQAVAESLGIAPTQEQIDTYSAYADTYGQNYCTMVALMDAVTSTLTSGAVVS